VIDDDGFACVVDAHGTTVRITAVPEHATATYTVLGWKVDDLDTTIDGLVAAGVAFLRFDGMEQDDRGAWTAPGGHRIAWFADPDGNTLSLHSPA
jgi:predicted enzyme related to lactoylglutathione lyase